MKSPRGRLKTRPYFWHANPTKPSGWSDFNGTPYAPYLWVCKRWESTLQDYLQNEVNRDGSETKRSPWKSDLRWHDRITFHFGPINSLVHCSDRDRLKRRETSWHRPPSAIWHRLPWMRWKLIITRIAWISWDRTAGGSKPWMPMCCRSSRVKAIPWNSSVNMCDARSAKRKPCSVMDCAAVPLLWLTNAILLSGDIHQSQWPSSDAVWTATMQIDPHKDWWSDVDFVPRVPT